MPSFIEKTGAANPLNGLSQPGFGSQPVLVDLDRDGDLDLVIAGSPGTFSYYRNTGTATAPAYVAMTGADNPFNGIDIGLSSSPAFGNLDDAGELDMVVGGQISGAVGSSNPLQFFQNTGAGYSAVAHPVNSIEPGRFSIPTLGDLDSDGLLDMIVGSDTGFLRYYRNTGTTSAASFTELTGASNPFNGVDFGLNSAPRLFDHDRDGDLDLIVGNLDTSSARASSLAYYRNDGPASAPVFVALTGSNNPFAGITADTIAAVALGDIDGDGDTDLVLPTRDGGVRLLLQNRDPVAVVDTFSTDEDTAITRNVLLANPTAPDSDPDGDALTIIEVKGSSALVGVPFATFTGRGSITLGADGTFTFDPEGDFDSFTSSGLFSEQISYTLSDGQGGRSVGTVNLSLRGLNDAPTTTPVTLDPINEDSPALTITQAMLLREAVDPDALAVLTATNLTQTGGNGTLTPLAGGSWSYQPDANDDTEVSFSYTISDGTATVAGSATLDIVPVNDAPQLGPGVLSGGTDEDTSTAVLTVGQLFPSPFWSDADSGALKGMAVLSVAAAGEWQYSLDGSTWLPVAPVSAAAALLLGPAAQLRYTPDSKNGETAELGYRAWDLTSGSATTGAARSTADTTSNGGTTAFSSVVAPISVRVRALNDAPTTTPVTLSAINEDGPALTINLATLLANAADVDLPAQTLSVTNVQINTGLGSVVSAGPDAWLFTPALNDDTEVSFSYTISDGSASVAGSATLDILPVNDAPTTTPVTLGSVQEDSAGRLITQALLLANAADVDRPAQTLTASNLQLTGNGTLTNLGGGSWSFRPAPNDETDVSFSYTISDGTDTVAGSATLDILPINDFPTNSGPVTLTAVLEDSPTFELPKADLLRNARDVDSSLSVTSLQLVFPSKGSVSYDAQGDRWLYTPAADDDTEVIFSYLGFDGERSVPVRATLDLLPVNDAPTTRPVTLTPINEDTTVTITPALLLANAADVDRPAQTLTVSNLQLTGGGTLQDNPDGTWSYTPAPNDDTGVSFSYTISDGSATVAGSATLDIVPVNDAPTTAPVTLDAIQEDSTALLITQQMLLANAADLDLPAQALSVSNLQLTGGGTLVNNNNGTWSYTPALNDDTGVSFSYTISDGSATVGGSATLDILPVNDAPTTRPVTLPPLAENSGTRTITQAMLLVHANDVDGTTPKAEDLQISGGLGNLADNGDGTWNYTPAPNDDTGVRFSYRVSDGTLGVAGSATLDITPVNQAPVAVNDSAQTSLNTGVNIAVLANDTDIDGLLLRVAATSQGSNGTVAIRPDGVSVRYTPNNGFSGFDNFTYAVSDGAGGSATASVRVVVASITGSNGNDTLLGTQQADFVLGQDGADRILTHDGADYVDAGRGADTITGGAGADTVLGGDGPDTFLATSAELAGDQIDGGNGTDVLVITNTLASLPANFSFTNLEQISFPGGLLVEHTSLLDLSSLTLASGSNNNIIGGTANSRITGTASADNIVDSAGNDDLRGAGGNDTIQGGFGQDTINGGTGNDLLYGGSATAPSDFVRDIFVFNTALNASTNVDQIIGFQANSQDQIQLDGSIFAAITGGATAGLDADEFRSVNGGHAVGANDFILFDPATGNLFYDADGNGPGAKVLFATLVGLTGTLDFTDFVGPVP